MATVITKKCCVIECKNKDLGADSGVIFYKFPDNKKLKKKWIDSCRLHEAGKDETWEPAPNDVLCNVHFVNGTRNPDDAHPCAVPQVFRSLRKGPKKKESFSGPLKEPVKRLQSAAARRTSLSTPTRNTPKEKAATPLTQVRSRGRPPKTKGGLKKPLRLTLGRGRPRKDATVATSVTSDQELLNQSGSVEEEKQEDDELEGEDEEVLEEEPVQLSDAGRPVRNKRKKLDDDYEDSSNLKSMAVVIERSNEKRVKLTAGEIIIKEEPVEETIDVADDVIFQPADLTKKTPGSKPTKQPKATTPYKVAKATAAMKAGKTTTSAKTSKPSTPTKLMKIQSQMLTSQSPIKFTKGASIAKCKKCFTLEQKVFKLEALEMSRNLNVKCQRCPIIEQELKKVEEELEDIIESKLSKCQRCALIEQKCRRVESNLRKTQSEMNKLQHRLSTIDITEETMMKYKNRVKSYTGFPTFEYLMLVFEHVKPKLLELGTKGISCFQMFILTIMRLKMNLPFWDLSSRFGVPTNYVQSLFPQYVVVMDSMLSHVILWPKANMEFRLQVLAGNLKQSFHCPYEKIEVSTLTTTNFSELTDKDKCVRVCAALYHISQLVSSNHSQQLLRILKTKEKEDSAKKAVEEKKDDDNEPSEKSNSEENTQTESNGDDNVDDSDIFLEDLGKESGSNSNDSLELELKHLRKELENTSQRVSSQFKFYTGLRNYQVFNYLLGFLKQHVAHISTDKLSHFQQLHLILIRFKLNLEVEDLGYIFSVDVDYIVQITRLWIEAMVRKLSCYIDWPNGSTDYESEKKLNGTVKLKYQILWNPALAPRNKETGRDKEKIEVGKLLRACAGIYNIDDIEVFRDGKKEDKMSESEDSNIQKTNEQLEESCRKLRSEIYDLRKNLMSSIATCMTEERLQNNDVMVQYLTGFNSFEVLKHVFNQIIPATKTDCRKTITPFQQFMVVLVRLKLNVSIQDLSYRVGMGQSNIFKIIQDWLKVLHATLTNHITWPDDDDDVEVFTEMLLDTYVYIKQGVSPKVADSKRTVFDGFDIATLVCAGLYNIGAASVSALKETSDFESFDDEW